jgi:hypothetical protein
MIIQKLTNGKAEDMPYDPTWEDSDIPDMVNIWLTQFEV